MDCKARRFPSAPAFCRRSIAWMRWLPIVNIARALPLDDAMRRVLAESGSSFDPEIVNIMNRRYVELEKMAQTCTSDPRAKLSTDLIVARGLEPAAGFETAQASAVAGDRKTDFLTSIAAARQEVQNLFELAQDLGNSLSLNETLSLLAIRLKRMIPYDALAIYVPHGDILKAEYASGENFRLFSSLEIPLGQGLSGWVAENHKPILNGNLGPGESRAENSRKFSPLAYSAFKMQNRPARHKESCAWSG